jgi:hypothetical protein
MRVQNLIVRPYHSDPALKDGGQFFAAINDSAIKFSGRTHLKAARSAGALTIPHYTHRVVVRQMCYNNA